MKPRKYQLKRRAEQQQETRLRIVEALVSLHEELGPRATTVSAIAERAGVQRLTVYRHFPDDASLMEACSTHWAAANPPPDPAQWADTPAPQRMRAGLEALYAYYRRTQRMWDRIYRDDDLPEVRAPLTHFEDYLHDFAAALEGGTEAPPTNPRRAVLRHALGYPNWASLQREGLNDAQMAEVVSRWLEVLAESPT